MRLVVLILAGILGGAGIAEGAPAKTEAALVLDLQGQTTPALQRFAEIAGDTKLSLGKDARITFLHYGTCRKMRVKGGTVSFTSTSFQVNGGVVEQESQEPCPRTFKAVPKGEAAGAVVREIGEVAGIVTRSAKPLKSTEAVKPLLSLQPKLLMLGEKAEAYGAVRIVWSGQTVVELPIRDREANWPAGAPALATNTDYDLVLVPKSGDAASKTIAVRTQPATAPGDADPLMIIRLE